VAVGLAVGTALVLAGGVALGVANSGVGVGDGVAG
jgi:hypothetical protein